MEGKVEECLRRAAERLGALYLVLYGSRARGYAGPHSDYDVAVKLGRKPSLREMGLLHVELERCLPAGSRLDLLVLDYWNLIAAWEALARGRIIYHRGRRGLSEYHRDLARAIDEVADLEPLINLFRRERRRAHARARG